MFLFFCCSLEQRLWVQYELHQEASHGGTSREHSESEPNCYKLSVVKGAQNGIWTWQLDLWLSSTPQLAVWYRTCSYYRIMGNKWCWTVNLHFALMWWFALLLWQMMDISKMPSDDASFTAPFKLVAEQNDYVHILVAYFDVSFMKCHKLIGFSTGISAFLIFLSDLCWRKWKQFVFSIWNHAGPRSKTTHWKQTVLYLEDVITICEGEAIVGSVTVAPNKKNPLGVDIKLKYSFNGQWCSVSQVQFYKMR